MVPDKASGAVARLALYVIGTLLFSSAALYNGYPLVFYDSGAYLRGFIEFHNLPDRPIFYSIFLGLLHWRWSLWPIVLGQSLLAVFVVERTLAHLAPRSSIGFGLVVLFCLTALTSLPWFSGQIMPDIFALVLALALYLVVAEGDELSWWEYAACFLILCVAEATHYTHITLALGLLGVLCIASVAFKIVALRRLVPLGLATALAIAAVCSINYAERREIVFTPYGSIFLLSRLLEYGTAQEYLAANCSSEPYRICRYLDELKALRDKPGQFIWDDAGVLSKLGGPESYRVEAAAVARETIRNAPIEHLRYALEATAQQLFSFSTGNQFGRYGEGDQIYRMISIYFPREMEAYLHSREYSGTLDFTTINMVHVPIGYFSLLAFVALLIPMAAKRDRKLATLAIVVAAILVGNAFLCGALSSGDSRYQSRVMPLVLLVVMIGAARLWLARPIKLRLLQSFRETIGNG